MPRNRITGARRTIILIAGIVVLVALAVRWIAFDSSNDGWGLALWVLEGIAILTILVTGLWSWVKPSPRRRPTEPPV